MTKIVKQIHLWLSVPFGLIISLICFSGAMLVFEKEIMEASNPRLYFVEEIGEKPLPLDILASKVAATLPEGVEVTGITVFSDPQRTYQVSLSKPRRASVYINPYTGEVTGEYKRAAFFTTMFKLHRWLMGSARNEDGSLGLGKLIVGISTLVFVFVLISGIFIWWPRNRKMLKNRLTIETHKGWRRFWYDLHVAGGFYAAIFLLAMALTGLTWSFQWYRNGFYTVFGVETQHSGGHGATHGGNQAQGHRGKGSGGAKEQNQKQAPYCLHWQGVYEKLATKNPDFKQITVSKGNASVSFDRYGNQRASDRYTFDTQNGTITDVMLYQDTPKSGIIRGWIYSVHVGSWGGLLTRILTFMAALLGASLPLTGYYLWLKRVLQR